MVANVPWQKEASRSITPAARPPGDGRGRRRRRAGPRGRAPGDRPRRPQLHRRHAGRARRAGAGLPSCSRSSATTPRPGWPRGSATRRSSPARRWSSSTAPASRCACPTTSPWIHVEVPRLEVSSTDLRARFVDGRPLDYLVTDPVLAGDRRPGPVRERGVTALPGRRRRSTLVAGDRGRRRGRRRDRARRSSAR